MTTATSGNPGSGASASLHRRLFTTVAALAAALVCTACGAADEQSRANLAHGTVRAEIAGIRLDVPVRYMYSEGFIKHGRWPKPKPGIAKLGALSISVLLPDLRPYRDEDDARWKVRGHGERLELDIGKAEKAKNKARISEIEAFISKGRFYSRAEPAYGMVHYSSNTGDNYFAEDRELGMKCSPDRPPTPDADFWSPSCMVYSTRTDGLVFRYYYSSRYLPHWKSIDEGLNALVDKFINDAAASH